MAQDRTISSAFKQMVILKKREHTNAKKPPLTVIRAPTPHSDDNKGQELHIYPLFPTQTNRATKSLSL